jgi:hypothetical protein
LICAGVHARRGTDTVIQVAARTITLGGTKPRREEQASVPSMFRKGEERTEFPKRALANRTDAPAEVNFSA